MSGETRRSYRSPIKAWTDPAAWAERLAPEGCPFCPMEPWGAHVELPSSWVLIPEEAVLPGYVLVVSKEHVIEPYELPTEASGRFWADCMRTAAAVASVVHPVKMNYEIHGNTIPHLHLHVFPRFRGDPFERTPIDPHAVTPTQRSPAEIDALRRAIEPASEISRRASEARVGGISPAPMSHIRPIVIGVAIRDDRVLAIEGFDSRKGERFYRPPGGGIEFGETSEDALRREFREELGIEPSDAGYLGALENVFTLEGQPGHEIILVYRVVLPPDQRFAADPVTGVESDGVPFTATWLPLSSARAGSAILYPDGLLKLLDRT